MLSLHQASQPNLSSTLDVHKPVLSAVFGRQSTLRMGMKRPPDKEKPSAPAWRALKLLLSYNFNPARMELNSIAFNDKYEKAICSSLYEVFYVHREDIVLPEYLKLIVKQDWFTRYCEFLGQGSAREYCRFANISEINIELPDIETQKKAVYCDKVINERIALKRRINDNLEAQLSAIYHLYFDELHILCLHNL